MTERAGNVYFTPSAPPVTGPYASGAFEQKFTTWAIQESSAPVQMYSNNDSRAPTDGQPTDGQWWPRSSIERMTS